MKFNHNIQIFQGHGITSVFRSSSDRLQRNRKITYPPMITIFSTKLLDRLRRNGRELFFQLSYKKRQRMQHCFSRGWRAINKKFQRNSSHRF